MVVKWTAIAVVAVCVQTLLHLVPVSADSVVPSSQAKNSDRPFDLQPFVHHFKHGSAHIIACRPRIDLRPQPEVPLILNTAYHNSIEVATENPRRPYTWKWANVTFTNADVLRHQFEARYTSLMVLVLHPQAVKDVNWSIFYYHSLYWTAINTTTVHYAPYWRISELRYVKRAYIFVVKAEAPEGNEVLAGQQLLSFTIPPLFVFGTATAAASEQNSSESVRAEREQAQEKAAVVLKEMILFQPIYTRFTFSISKNKNTMQQAMKDPDAEGFAPARIDAAWNSLLRSAGRYLSWQVYYENKAVSYCGGPELHLQRASAIPAARKYPPLLLTALLVEEFGPNTTIGTNFTACTAEQKALRRTNLALTFPWQIYYAEDVSNDIEPFGVTQYSFVTCDGVSFNGMLSGLMESLNLWVTIIALFLVIKLVLWGIFKFKAINASSSQLTFALMLTFIFEASLPLCNAQVRRYLTWIIVCILLMGIVITNEFKSVLITELTAPNRWQGVRSFEEALVKNYSVLSRFFLDKGFASDSLMDHLVECCTNDTDVNLWRSASGAKDSANANVYCRFRKEKLGDARLQSTVPLDIGLPSLAEGAQAGVTKSLMSSVKYPCTAILAAAEAARESKDTGGSMVPIFDEEILKCKSTIFVDHSQYFERTYHKLQNMNRKQDKKNMYKMDVGVLARRKGFLFLYTHYLWDRGLIKERFRWIQAAGFHVYWERIVQEDRVLEYHNMSRGMRKEQANLTTTEKKFSQDESDPTSNLSLDGTTIWALFFVYVGMLLASALQFVIELKWCRRSLWWVRRRIRRRGEGQPGRSVDIEA